MRVADCLLCGDLVDRGGRLTLDHGLALAADAAPIRPGHLLLHSLEHSSSFAALNSARLAAAGRVLRELNSRERSRGNVTLAFEHGTTGSSPRASGCVDHAHVHVLPLSRDDAARIPARLEDALPSGLAAPAGRIGFEELSSLQNREYYWVRTGDEMPMLFTPAFEERQMLRRVVAAILGIAMHRTWDAYDLPSAALTTGLLTNPTFRVGLAA